MVTPSGKTVMDGVAVQFDDRFNNGVDIYDAVKMPNSSENLALLSSKRLLVFERRKVVHTNDTLYLQLTNTRIADYSMLVSCSDMDLSSSDAWLYDRFTRIMTPLNLNGDVYYSFQVQNEAGSRDPGRFVIVFKKSNRPTWQPQLIVHRTEEGVRLDWDGNKQIEVSGFEILHSLNGRDFEVVGTIWPQSGQTPTTSYSWVHKSMAEGDMYYYVRALLSEEGQRTVNSNVAQLEDITLPGLVEIHPNPVEGKQLYMQTKGLPAGRYKIQIIDGSGRNVHFVAINSSGVDAVWKLSLPQTLSGYYSALITSNEGKRKRIALFIK
jgi:hypothetical protein